MPFRIECGPERLVLTDGLQPFGFRTASGKIIVQAQTTFPVGYRQPERNRWPGMIATVVSKDDGRSWALWHPKPEQGLGPVTEGAATPLSDGTFLMLNWVAEFTAPGAPWAGKRWLSRDDFATVEGPLDMEVEIPQAKIGFDDGGAPYGAVTFHRTVMEIPGGDLLAAAYCWFEGDDTPSTYQPNMCKMRSVLLRSADRGRHWRYVSTIAVDPTVGQEGFDEPVMVRLARGPRAGRLICLMRTGNDDSPLYQAHSDDEGRTWSSPRRLHLIGVDPDLKALSDGTLVCSMGRRIFTNSGQRHHEKGYHLAFSTDQGDTWSPMLQTPPMEAYSMTVAGRRPEEPSGLLKPGDRVWTDYSTVLEIAPDSLLLLYDVGMWGLTIRYIASRTIRVFRS